MALCGVLNGLGMGSSALAKPINVTLKPTDKKYKRAPDICMNCFQIDKDEELNRCVSCARTYHPSCGTETGESVPILGTAWTCERCDRGFWPCFGCKEYGDVAGSCEVWCGIASETEAVSSEAESLKENTLKVTNHMSENNTIDGSSDGMSKITVKVGGEQGERVGTTGRGVPEKQDVDGRALAQRWPTEADRVEGSIVSEDLGVSNVKGEAEESASHDDLSTVLRCSVPFCPVFYHYGCIPDKSWLLNGRTGGGGFKCSGHKCRRCERKTKGLKRCINCLKAYHMPRCGVPEHMDMHSNYFMVCKKHRNLYEEPESESSDSDEDGFMEIEIFPNHSDENNNSSRGQNLVDALIRKVGTRPAKGVWRCPKRVRDFKIPAKLRMQVQKLREREALRMRPPKFCKIVANRYRTVKRQPVSEKITACECKVSNGVKCDTNMCINRAMNAECSKKCGEECKNQRLAKRQWAKHSIKNTAGRGFGMFSKEPLKEDDLIIEYLGEIVDEDECNKRIRKMQKDGAKNFYFLKVSPSMVIDATVEASNGRFMNHSCDPNCIARRWIVGGFERVGLYAKRDIEEGEELTWDYNFAIAGDSKQACLCGSSNCSGFFGVKKVGKKSANKKRKRHIVEDAISFDSIKIAAQKTRRLKSTLSNRVKNLAQTSRVFLCRNVELVRRSMLEIQQVFVDTHTADLKKDLESLEKKAKRASKQTDKFASQGALNSTSKAAKSGGKSSGRRGQS
ncbi:hypothetical protein AAMO2058_001362100 [Amorphochlora amoebiformis]